MEAGVTAGSPVGTAVADIEHVGSGSRRLSGHRGRQQLSLTVETHVLNRLTAPRSPSDAGFSGAPTEHMSISDVWMSA